MKSFWRRIAKPATRQFLEEARHIVGFSWFDRLHAFIYTRFLYRYISLAIHGHPLAGPLGRLVERLAARNESGAPVQMADTYHGKVVTLAAARQLVSVREEIRLTDLEKVIPYPLARDIVLQHPDHILALDCPCRAARPNPCLPLDVCLIVGEPFAGMVYEHQPQHARWITPTEALGILQAENERGHVQHAFFKDALLGRFYAICNCCPCCCGAVQMHKSGVPMLASSGYVCRVDENLCAACGACVSRCPFSAIALETNARIDAAACMGCGVCLPACPQDALSLQRAPERGEPLELDALLRAARQSGHSS